MSVACALLLLAAQDEVATLLDRLGSDEVAVREGAHAGLVERGVKVLDVVAARPVPGDPEAAARIDGIVRAIVNRCIRAEWKSPVTLDAKEAPLATVLESLRKQTSFKIEVEDQNLPPVERLQLDRVPFEQALATILEKAGLDLLRTDAEGIRIGRLAHLTFRFTKVDVAVIFKVTTGVTGVTIRRGPGVAGAIDLACENRAWTGMIDDLAAGSGWVALWTGPKELSLRLRTDFEKDAKTESFPLVHLRPEDPVKDRPGRFALFARTLESSLSHGASWATVHGKWSYDPRRRAVVITDRAEVIAEAARLVKELDRKAE